MRNVLLSGVGGQGTVLATKVLAQAAWDRVGKLRTAETIGMAQRGGNVVVSHVRMGDADEVFAPRCWPRSTADLVIAFRNRPKPPACCVPRARRAAGHSRYSHPAGHGGAQSDRSPIAPTTCWRASGRSLAGTGAPSSPVDDDALTRRGGQTKGVELSVLLAALSRRPHRARPRRPATRPPEGVRKAALLSPINLAAVDAVVRDKSSRPRLTPCPRPAA